MAISDMPPSVPACDVCTHVNTNDSYRGPGVETTKLQQSKCLLNPTFYNDSYITRKIKLKKGAFICANNPDESDVFYLKFTYHFLITLSPYPMN